MRNRLISSYWDWYQKIFGCVRHVYDTGVKISFHGEILLILYQVRRLFSRITNKIIGPLRYRKSSEEILSYYLNRLWHIILALQRIVSQLYLVYVKGVVSPQNMEFVKCTVGVGLRQLLPHATIESWVCEWVNGKRLHGVTLNRSIDHIDSFARDYCLELSLVFQNSSNSCRHK